MTITHYEGIVTVDTVDIPVRVWSWTPLTLTTDPDVIAAFGVVNALDAWVADAEITRAEVLAMARGADVEVYTAPGGGIRTIPNLISAPPTQS
jgi:hypothetical protein